MLDITNVLSNSYSVILSHYSNVVNTCFISVDPLQFKYPIYTPYQYAGNKPISYIDLDGAEEKRIKRNNKRQDILNKQNEISNNLYTKSVNKMNSQINEEQSSLLKESRSKLDTKNPAEVHFNEPLQISFIITMKLSKTIDDGNYQLKVYSLEFSIDVDGDITPHEIKGDWVILRNILDPDMEMCCSPEKSKEYELFPVNYQDKPSFLVETIHPNTNQETYSEVKLNGNLWGSGDDVYIHAGNHPRDWRGCWGISNLGLSKDFTIRKKDGRELFTEHGLINTQNSIGNLYDEIENTIGSDWKENENKKMKIIFE